MTTFHFDTSGSVERLCGAPAVPKGNGQVYGWITWLDLAPFVQGYVEAMFAEFRNKGYTPARPKFSYQYAFSDLAPETLARIMEDCEVAASLLGRNHLPDDGAWFWNGGQRQPGFPPLTVYLGDDGKVRFQ